MKYSFVTDCAVRKICFAQLPWNVYRISGAEGFYSSHLLCLQRNVIDLSYQIGKSLRMGGMRLSEYEAFAWFIIMIFFVVLRTAWIILTTGKLGREFYTWANTISSFFCGWEKTGMIKLLLLLSYRYTVFLSQKNVYYKLESPLRSLSLESLKEYTAWPPSLSSFYVIVYYLSHVQVSVCGKPWKFVVFCISSLRSEYFLHGFANISHNLIHFPVFFLLFSLR